MGLELQGEFEKGVRVGSWGAGKAEHGEGMRAWRLCFIHRAGGWMDGLVSEVVWKADTVDSDSKSWRVA